MSFFFICPSLYEECWMGLDGYCPRCGHKDNGAQCHETARAGNDAGSSPSAPPMNAASTRKA